MKTRYLIQFLIASILSVTTVAEEASWHHIHPLVDDTKEAAEWYAKYLGGRYAINATFDTAFFGESIVRFRSRGGTKVDPKVCAVDHIALSLPDVAATLKALRGSGAKIVAELSEIEGLRAAEIRDPWGLKVQLVEDQNFFGFHHVHLYAADPGTTLEWFKTIFGGKEELYDGQVGALRYADMLLVTEKLPKRKKIRPAPVAHLSWGFVAFDEAVAKIKASGTTRVLGPIKSVDPRGNRVIFINAPGGTQIEVTELID